MRKGEGHTRGTENIYDLGREVKLGTTTWEWGQAGRVTGRRELRLAKSSGLKEAVRIPEDMGGVHAQLP